MKAFWNSLLTSLLFAVGAALYLLFNLPAFLLANLPNLLLIFLGWILWVLFSPFLFR